MSEEINVIDPRLAIYVKVRGFSDRAVACRIAMALGVTGLDWSGDDPNLGAPPYVTDGDWQLGATDDFWLRKHAVVEDHRIFELNCVTNSSNHRRNALYGLVEYLNSDLVFGNGSS